MTPNDKIVVAEAVLVRAPNPRIVVAATVRISDFMVYPSLVVAAKFGPDCRKEACFVA